MTSNISPSFWKRAWQWIRTLGRRSGTKVSASQVSVVQATVTYAVKDGLPLAMDVYRTAGPGSSQPKILVLFVHGGGFSEGARDDPRYVQFAEKLSRSGYLVASLSYRLTMKGRSFGCDQPAENKIQTFRAAAEDIWDATRYLLEHSAELELGHPRIVLCGSSAGAEAVMHAAYWPDAKLPAGFRYAGVIGMAAALIELDWINEGSAIPTLVFHGADDPLVPYGSSSHHYCTPDQPGFLILHGSASIAEKLKELNKPYTLITGLEGGHGWADKPMFDHFDWIERFLGREVAWSEFHQIEEKWWWR